MKKMILDLDTGVDDTLALAFAALSPEIELLGVTGTYGNIDMPSGVQNSLDMLALLERDDVPVFAGEEHAMRQSAFIRHEVSARIHGENGVGQVRIPRSTREKESESAIDFLSRTMKNYQEELTIVTTGPMTNLATVLIRNPSLRQWRGKVVFMGGALTVRGNVSHFAEANISQDPEAAKLVLESMLDITMVGLDVTMRSRISMKEVAVWRQKKSIRGNIFGDMLEYYIKNTLDIDETYIHDPSAVICAIHPEFFTILPLYLTIETDGQDRGRTLVDHIKIRERDPSTKVCVDVEAEKVENLIRAVLEKL
jgi:purine nucleosidase